MLKIPNNKKSNLCDAVFHISGYLLSKCALDRMEELELSQRCKQGDNTARKELYERYAGRLLAICIRYVRERATAEDLLHDGFIKIFEAMDQFTWRGKGSLRAWMSRIMVNTALQYLRTTQRKDQMVLVEELPEKEVEVDQIETIPKQTLLKFIAELPDGYRTVFNLFVLEDKSHKEIAELLGINEKSSASQLYRARCTLAERVNEWLAENS